LTDRYLRHVAQGDGPAFLALYAPSLESASARLEAARVEHHRDGSFLDFGERDGLGYLFLGPRNRSPTDRGEHFVHANGATSLVAAWLAGDDLSAERRLFHVLGARVVTTEVRVPEAAAGALARSRQRPRSLSPPCSRKVRRASSRPASASAASAWNSGRLRRPSKAGLAFSVGATA
jgi:hypothetical protein